MRGPATTASGYGSPSVEAVARFAPGPEQDLSNDLPPAKVDNHGVGVDLADASSPGPASIWCSSRSRAPVFHTTRDRADAKRLTIMAQDPLARRSLLRYAQAPLVPHHPRSGRACRTSAVSLAVGPETSSPPPYVAVSTNFSPQGMPGLCFINSKYTLADRLHLRVANKTHASAAN